MVATKQCCAQAGHPDQVCVRGDHSSRTNWNLGQWKAICKTSASPQPQKFASRRGHNVLLMQAMRGAVCVRKEAHEGCSAKGLWMHLAEECCGGRKVDLFYSVPSVMLQLKPFSKDPTDLLPHEVLKFILIGFRKLNIASILPGNESQIFQVKITLNPINIMGEQIKGALTLSFPWRGSASVPSAIVRRTGCAGLYPHQDA